MWAEHKIECTLRHMNLNCITNKPRNYTEAGREETSRPMLLLKAVLSLGTVRLKTKRAVPK